MTPKVIIVGAGVGGMATAYRLNQLGIETEIHEASERAGGRIVTLERNGDRVDVGAQTLHSSYRATIALMKELGLHEQWRPINGRTCYWVKGKAPWVGGSHASFIGPLGLQGNFALYRLMIEQILLARRPPLHTICEAGPLDDVSAADFFANWRGELLSQYILPMLCSVMNVATPSFTSVQHLLHILRISAFTEAFSLPSGLETFPLALSKRVDITYKSPVEMLFEENGRIAGVKLQSSGEIRRASHVVVAVAPNAVARLLPPNLISQAQFFESIISTPQPIPIFFLDRPLPDKVFAYLGDPRRGGKFWFALNAANKSEEMVPSGRAILTLWTQYPHSVALDAMSDEAIFEIALKELPDIVPGFDASWIIDRRMQRHRFSHPPYAPGSYRSVLKFKESLESVRGVSFVSDVFGGAYMESSLRSAEGAVKQICRWDGLR
ncbi:MAG: FAD-dependent oxidoreductase [Parvularculaceae bacterium]